MAKIVLKKLPPGPKPARNQLDLRGHSPLPWPAAVKLAGKSKGNVLHTHLGIVHERRLGPSTYHRRENQTDIAGALAYAKELVQSGRAIRAQVCGEAGYNYPGARSVSWQLGGFECVEIADVVPALAGMSSGHDYTGSNGEGGTFLGETTTSVAAQVGISAADCYLLLREAEALQLVRSRDLRLAGSPAAKRANLRWYAVRYWRMELAKIERKAAGAAQTRAGL